MNFTRLTCPVKSRLLTREIVRQFSLCSRLNEASSPTTQPLVQEEKFDFENLNVLERTERRKPKIPPFMKNVYVSIFNTDLLAFPEILNKDESEALDERVKTIEGILNNREISQVDKETAIKHTGIFGGPISLTQGGLAMIATERLRYLETLSLNPVLANRISDHWVGLGALKNGLEKNELLKIVPDLVSGDQNVSLCTNERIASSINQLDLRTSASQKSERYWHIDGEKLCFYQDGYKLVLASVERNQYKVFLVNPDAAGVTYKKPYVTFIDTPAIILDQAPETSLTLSSTRLDTCVLSYSILRNLIDKIEKYVRGKFVSGNPFADLPLLRTKVSEAMHAVYTAESMAYFTAGLIDGYEDPDVELEVAMCRSYITERTTEHAMRLLSIPGLESLHEEWTEPLNHLRALQLKHDSIDTLNIFIGLMALEYAGKNMYSSVKQIRNPLFNPGFIIKKMVSDRHQAKDDPKLTLYLQEFLHPSLQAQATKLEYSVLRLQYACEMVLSRYGREVFLQHNDLERIARAGTEVLAMTAVLARASRSYCIGVRHADVEMRLAAASSELGRMRVQRLVKECEDGEYINMDNLHTRMGREILDGGRKQLVEPPTTRVWW